MPTFYDPIELEEFDIKDSSAHFYIIPIGPNHYKFCATTQNLNSLDMKAGDPETRARFYWPITRQQLRLANMRPLFPNNKIRTSLMTAAELEDIFHFNIIAQDYEIFGHSHSMNYNPNQLIESITWQTRPPKTISNASLLRKFNEVYTKKLRDLASEVNMTRQQYASLTIGLNTLGEKYSKENHEASIRVVFNFLNIYSSKFPFSLLVQFPPNLIELIVSQDIREAIQNDQFTLEQILHLKEKLQLVDLKQNDVSLFTDSNYSYINYILKHKESILYLLNGTLTVQDFVNQAEVASKFKPQPNRAAQIDGYNNTERPRILLQPSCMMVVKEGFCSAQDLIDLDTIPFFLITKFSSALDAIRQGRTTLEMLKNLPLKELELAIKTDEYPAPNARENSFKN